MQHKQENQVSSPSEEEGEVSASLPKMKIFLLSFSNEVQYCEIILYLYSFLVGVQYRLYLSDQLVCRLYMFVYGFKWQHNSEYFKVLNRCMNSGGHE